MEEVPIKPVNIHPADALCQALCSTLRALSLVSAEKKKKKKKKKHTFVMLVIAHHLGCWDIFIDFSLSILDRYVGWGGHNLFSPL